MLVLGYAKHKLSDRTKKNRNSRHGSSNGISMAAFRLLANKIRRSNKNSFPTEPMLLDTTTSPTHSCTIPLSFRLFLKKTHTNMQSGIITGKGKKALFTKCQPPLLNRLSGQVWCIVVGRLDSTTIAHVASIVVVVV